MGYRGYLLNRMHDVFGRGAHGVALSVTLVSVAFGLSHQGQGSTGIVDNVVGGLVLAGLYLASGRNLWLPIIAHGVEGTTSLLLLSFGFQPPG